MGWFRRKPRVRRYGDCSRCGHDWREHRGSAAGEDVCSECRYEHEHGTADAPDELCDEVAPAPPSTASTALDARHSAATGFEGVTPEEVRSTGTGLYEVRTTAGVPINLHDMSLTRVSHDATARTLVMEFLYDDPQWTPPEAAATPVAVFSFDDVEVLDHADEPAPPDTPQEDLSIVQGFDFDERSGVFALWAYATSWVFRASKATISLRSASNG